MDAGLRPQRVQPRLGLHSAAHGRNATRRAVPQGGSDVGQHGRTPTSTALGNAHVAAGDGALGAELRPAHGLLVQLVPAPR